MASVLDARWQRSIGSQADRLQKTKYKNFIGRFNYALFRTLVESDNTRYGGRFLPRHAKRLGHILGEFEVFVRSISTMVQGGGEIALLVWGAIQAVLDVSVPPCLYATSWLTASPTGR